MKLVIISIIATLLLLLLPAMLRAQQQSLFLQSLFVSVLPAALNSNNGTTASSSSPFRLHIEVTVGATVFESSSSSPSSSLTLFRSRSVIHARRPQPYKHPGVVPQQQQQQQLEVEYVSTSDDEPWTIRNDPGQDDGEDIVLMLSKPSQKDADDSIVQLFPFPRPLDAAEGAPRYNAYEKKSVVAGATLSDMNADPRCSASNPVFRCCFNDTNPASTFYSVYSLGRNTSTPILCTAAGAAAIATSSSLSSSSSFSSPLLAATFGPFQVVATSPGATAINQTLLSPELNIYADSFKTRTTASVANSASVLVFHSSDRNISVSVEFDLHSSFSSTAVSSLQQLATSLSQALQSQQQQQPSSDDPVRLCFYFSTAAAGAAAATKTLESFVAPQHIFGTTRNKLGYLGQQYAAVDKQCGGSRESNEDLTSISVPGANNAALANRYNQLSQVLSSLSLSNLLAQSAAMTAAPSPCVQVVGVNSSNGILHSFRLKCNNSGGGGGIENNHLQLQITADVTHSKLQRLFPVNVVIGALCLGAKPIEYEREANNNNNTATPVVTMKATLKFCVDVWNRGDVETPRGSLLLLLISTTVTTQSVSPSTSSSSSSSSSSSVNFDNVATAAAVTTNQREISVYGFTRLCVAVNASLLWAPQDWNVTGTARVELHDAAAGVIATVRSVPWTIQRISDSMRRKKRLQLDAEAKLQQFQAWLARAQPPSQVVFEPLKLPPFVFSELNETERLSVKLYRQLLASLFPDPPAPAPTTTASTTTQPASTVTKPATPSPCANSSSAISDSAAAAAAARFAVSAAFISLSCVVWIVAAAAGVVILWKKRMSRQEKAKLQEQKNDGDDDDEDCARREGSPYFEMKNTNANNNNHNAKSKPSAIVSMPPAAAAMSTSSRSSAISAPRSRHGCDDDDDDDGAGATPRGEERTKDQHSIQIWIQRHLEGQHDNNKNNNCNNRRSSSRAPSESALQQQQQRPRRTLSVSGNSGFTAATSFAISAPLGLERFASSTAATVRSSSAASASSSMNNRRGSSKQHPDGGSHSAARHIARHSGGGHGSRKRNRGEEQMSSSSSSSSILPHLLRLQPSHFQHQHQQSAAQRSGSASRRSTMTSSSSNFSATPSIRLPEQIREAATAKHGQQRRSRSRPESSTTQSIGLWAQDSEDEFCVG